MSWEPDRPSDVEFVKIVAVAAWFAGPVLWWQGSSWGPLLVLVALLLTLWVRQKRSEQRHQELLDKN